ncbi:MAG: hypothetical protein AAF616_13980 [Bacteroidota bacterium]
MELESALDYLETTKSYLDANQTIWSEVPIVSTYRDHLAEAIRSIKESLEEQNEKTDFSSNTLQQLRITIAEKMDIMDDILEAYADDVNDKRLLDEAKNSKTDYLRLTNDGFERKVDTILTLLKKHQIDLKPYGFRDENLQDVLSDFQAYKALRANPRSLQKGNLKDNAQIGLLVKEGLAACEKLRKVIVSFRTSHSSFFKGFMAIEADSSTVSTEPN